MAGPSVARRGATPHMDPAWLSAGLYGSAVAFALACCMHAALVFVDAGVAPAWPVMRAMRIAVISAASPLPWLSLASASLTGFAVCARVASLRSRRAGREPVQEDATTTPRRAPRTHTAAALALTCGLWLAIGVVSLQAPRWRAECITSATVGDDADAVRAYARLGYRVDLRDSSGDTLLLIAAASQSRAVVAVLLSAGADPNAANRDGVAPLDMAVFLRDAEVVERLIAAGADVSRPVPETGVTPLQEAVGVGDADLAARLLAADAEVDAANARGLTALHIAARNGEPDLVALLLSNGAAPATLTARGSSPLDLARENGHDDVVQILLAHGAKTGAELRGASEE